MSRRSSFNIGFIIKILVLIIIIMGIVLVVNICSGGSCIRKIDKSIPSIQMASWEVTTRTHLYYAESVMDTEKQAVLINWYELKDDKWVRHTGDLILEKAKYGNISINRR